MIIRKAEKNDVDRIIEIFDEARGTIAKLGIDQWQDGYPTREIADDDISAERSYVIEIDGKVCATFVILLGGDPTYNIIYDGEWLCGNEEKRYAAIHRVAIAVECRGHGIAEEMLSFVGKIAKEHDLLSLRIDTHEGNIVMRRMLERNRFTYCGVIHLENGAPRVAYEFKL